MVKHDRSPQTSRPINLNVFEFKVKIYFGRIVTPNFTQIFDENPQF